MSNKEKDDFNVDSLLNNLFKLALPKASLKELFERRVHELKISATNVAEILKIEYRALYGILEGTQKRIDFTNLIKIADFLQLPKEQVVQLYLELLEKNFPADLPSSPDKVEFIKENFDLINLRKVGFIDSITDFAQIEKKIVSFFGLRSIFDYKKPDVHVAFSAGLLKPKNELTRSMWIKTANDYFEEIANPYEYDRQALIDYFPQIRWHSTSVSLGLINVIRDVFKMGVTVMYQPSFPSLHLRGATFSVNDKPCIAITNYVGFYPTLWWALIHELFHVLFDWDEISTNKYHLSDEDDSEQLTVKVKEQEADNFAREYLFSKEKTKQIRPYIKDEDKVKEFALINHVHPSFVYVFNAYDTGKTDRVAWALARRQNPESEMTNFLVQLNNSWDDPKPIKDFIKSIHYDIYK